jgi:site-specific recombinase XerD
MEGKGRLERVLREAVRRPGYSYRTEESHVVWYRRFVRFRGLRHPETMEAGEIEAFLNHLAGNRRVAAGTQNQAFSALVFLYRQALGIELAEIDARRAKEKKRLPVVLSVVEVKRLLAEVPEGTPWTRVGLLYGCLRRTGAPRILVMGRGSAILFRRWL